MDKMHGLEKTELLFQPILPHFRKSHVDEDEYEALAE
jgi:hypothetical protein